MNLVTGAAGHLGNVLVRELLDNHEKVRALVLPGEDLSSLQGLDVEIIEGNILDPESIKPAFKNIEYVFHMAALVAITADKQDLLYKVNVEGTRNVIEEAKLAGVKRLIYTSSIHALQRPPEGVTIDETLPFDPENIAGAYDRTKAQASILVLETALHGFDALVVCPTGVIGPHDYRQSEVGGMILEWMKKKPSISVDGHFDFVDVRDVAKGHILARDYGKSGEIYLLSGEQVEISSVRQWVQSVVGIKTREIKFSAPIAYLVAPLAEVYYKLTKTKPQFTRYSIETLQSNSKISSRKAIKELGYKPRALFESVRDTVQWWLYNFSKTSASLRLPKKKSKNSI